MLISDDNHEILEAARHVFGHDFKFQLCTHHYMEKIEAMSPCEENDPLVELIRRIIHSSKKKDLYRRLAFLVNNQHKLCHKRYQKEIFLDFKEHVKQLVTYVFYPDYIPRTNNEIENLFRQLNLRLKTIGRFYHHEYAAKFLNGWALMRRFTAFTDCKDPNKHRNGKAPLELAECDIKGIDYFKL